MRAPSEWWWRRSRMVTSILPAPSKGAVGAMQKTKFGQIARVAVPFTPRGCAIAAEGCATRPIRRSNVVHEEHQWQSAWPVDVSGRTGTRRFARDHPAVVGHGLPPVLPDPGRTAPFQPGADQSVPGNA